MERVLAAVPLDAMPTLARALSGAVLLQPVHALDEAKSLLRSDPEIGLVICGVHFDDSRMFDLLAHARTAAPGIPVVCCRVLDRELPRISIHAVAMSAASLGCAAFYDLPARVKDVGMDGADREFRSLLLKHLGRA